jgi:chemotaxis response regulator CheB
MQDGVSPAFESARIGSQHRICEEGKAMKKRSESADRHTETAGGTAAEAEAPQGNGRHGDAAFPIVGIGASAGGLEALELFLQNVPLGSGMAFVIVQHLDPTHKGIMVELLQRVTAM